MFWNKREAPDPYFNAEVSKKMWDKIEETSRALDKLHAHLGLKLVWQYEGWVIEKKEKDK